MPEDQTPETPDPETPQEPQEPSAEPEAPPAEPAQPEPPADPDPEPPAEPAPPVEPALQAPEPEADVDVAAIQNENLRLRVSLRVGLDEDLADRLRGTTEEELISDAESLKARLSGSKLPDRTPKPRLRGGSQPDEEPELSSQEVVKLALGR